MSHEDPTSTGDRSGARSAAFSALREHPDFAGWMTHDPAALDRTGCRDAMGLLLLVLAGVALSLLSLAFLPQLALVPVGLVLVGIVALLAQLLRKPKHSGPLERLPARIVDVRSQVSGASGASTTNHYRVVVEEESGTRHDLEAGAELASDLQIGSLGIAFRRGGGLEAFTALYT